MAQFVVVLVALVVVTALAAAHEQSPRTISTCDHQQGSSSQRPSMLQSTVRQQRPEPQQQTWQTPLMQTTQESQFAPAPQLQFTQAFDPFTMRDQSLPAFRGDQPSALPWQLPVSELHMPAAGPDLDRPQNSMSKLFADDLKSIDALRAELASDAASFNAMPPQQLNHERGFVEATPNRAAVESRVLLPTEPQLGRMSLVAASSPTTQLEPLRLRPHKEEGIPEMIEFGIYATRFYGADLKEDCFTMDNTMTLQWSDPRTVELLPSGADNVTLSDSEAEEQLWLPEVEITNRRIRSYELISTAVIVNRSGIVTKIERALAVIMEEFKVEAFPFDTQVLTQKIASTKYMLNDLILVPSEDPSLSGAPDDLCEGHGFDLESWNTSVISDVKGMLQKSRGLLSIRVKRGTARYTQEFIIPSVLLLCISWGVFWFPFIQPFITPRLALSILALLSFTTMSLRIDSMLPAGAPFTWSDLFIQNCQWMMFCTVKLNIITEVFCHTLKLDKLAKKMNNELKVLWPVMAMSSFLITFSHTDGKGLDMASHLFKMVIILECGCWDAWCAARYKPAADEAAQAAEDAAGKQPAQPAASAPAVADKGNRGSQDSFPRSSRNR